MADTIVTNSPGTNDSGAAGLVVALVIVIALIVGGIVLYQRGFFNGSAPTPAGQTNINVTVPTPTSGSGAAGGTTQKP